jgi:hypothetical protein|tara:strand:+ start:1609 stop:2115 length:507 start_codon:yes stop_codon:yes gene_type:complete
MININFIPLFDDKELTDAVEEYKKIWKKDSEKIIAVFKNVSKLSFSEKRIGVVIYEGVSYSGRTLNDPMKLRASLSTDIKKATLIHELGHRLLIGTGKPPPKDLSSHDVLFLILYDVWTELYGKEFADNAVNWESKREGRTNYEQFWNNVLSISKGERAKKFKEIMNK